MRRASLIVVSGAIIFFQCEIGHALTYYNFSGHMCVPAETNSGATLPDMMYDFRGLLNMSSAHSWPASCGIAGINADDIDVTFARVTVYDGNNNAVAGSALACELDAVSKSGYSAWLSPIRYSCSTAGGCGTCGSTCLDDVGYSDIDWTDPLNSGGLMVDVASYAFYCEVPKYDAGYSVIMHYRVQQVSP